MKRLLLLTVLALSHPSLARAECIMIRPITARDAVNGSALVFAGTVVKIEDPHAPALSQVVTFEVNRVWKGPAVRQHIVYHAVTAESRVFGVGESLVVFARELDAESRWRVGLPRSGERAFGYTAFSCSVDHPLEFNSELEQLPSVAVR